MKRIVLVLFAVCVCPLSLFAIDENIKTDKGSNTYVPESSFIITKSSTDSLFGIAVVPLSLQINSRKFFELGAGGDMEINPFERVGFQVHGMKSYYTGTSTGSSMDSRSDSYTAEGGITINLFIKRQNSEGPVLLGSRYTGYNTMTQYYAKCELPEKTMYSARIGYLRNSSSYTVKNDDMYATTAKENTAVDSVYAGLEWSLFYDAKITIRDSAIERDFGKNFSPSGKYKMYADVIVPVYKTGNIDKKYPVGFRVGYTTWAFPWFVKIEGGINPAFGGFVDIEMGVCYF